MRTGEAPKGTMAVSSQKRGLEQGDSSTSYQRLIEIGIALSTERNHNRLMERILLEAKELANADGGTLYLRTDTDTLKFEIMRTDSLGIALGGTTGKPITFPPLRLYDEQTKEANHKNVATHVALTGQSIAILDAYETDEFDFSGTRKFDRGTGYRSKSFLTVPLKNHLGEVIGVIQLLNARERASGEVVPFSAAVQPLVEAMASQAAVALDNQQLIEAQRELLNSFIQLIASAIDAKSPYTGGHCQRVPVLAEMIAKAACESRDGPFREFNLNEDEWYELHLAAWLHDCGKVTTPEYVVDKATKLETIFNRIHEVRLRFEIVKRDAEIAYLKALAAGGDAAGLLTVYKARLAEIDDDYKFVAECNVGGEFMAPDKVERLKKIGDVRWQRTLDDRIGLSHDELRRKTREPAAPLPAEERLLADKPEHIVDWEKAGPATDDSGKYGFRLDVPKHKFNLGEIYNLSIGRGTLTNEDRFQIANHVVQTIVMLEQLPFPKHLRRVPEFAGGHHEKLDGTGYPRKLEIDQMSVPARIIAIADIFEALTAADRPYKAPKTLSESIKIMSFMKKDKHIDPDLFDLFLAAGVFKDYAEKYLRPDQIDAVDIAPYVKKAS